MPTFINSALSRGVREEKEAAKEAAAPDDDRKEV